MEAIDYDLQIVKIEFPCVVLKTVTGFLMLEPGYLNIEVN